jgi:hypothetical protein
MILCSFVYFQKSRDTPNITVQETEIASAYWVPVSYLCSDLQWSSIDYPISRTIFGQDLWPRIDSVLQYVLGGIKFFGIPISPTHRTIMGHSSRAKIAIDRNFPIWGLTLWITSDLITLLGFPAIANLGAPRYSAPDVEFILSILLGNQRSLGSFLHRETIGYGLEFLTASRISIIISLGLRLSLTIITIWIAWQFL